ncbi:J domain-containing protein [Niabella ginsengisoli]|uniref:J domain-containing protein n=1 Tax=Niabella ginsengisoli TaxID=522298 RepID=A0ABS9SF12_9BACT|nr:J domain-containing protein [Niabella ginsengisoli]MCH5596948.1 J domain-containing protein [Niabella ginsengisoli]
MAIDYYQILKISPSADLSEIKTAYRKLAHQYHPDKNADNKSTNAYFELIKEAYETLSNPVRKEKYLQERWLHKAYGQNFELPINTPEDVLRQVLSASQKIHQMDIYRMNKEGIREELELLLTNENLKLLNDFNEISVNDAIVREFLQLVAVLPTNKRAAFYSSLQQINSNYVTDIKQTEEELAGKLFWETSRPAFVILLVILLCILIWGTSLKY